MSKRILAADIGGTHSRFAFFETDGQARLKLLEKTTFRTKDADSLSQLLEQLADSDFPLAPKSADMTVIALAGPVKGGLVVGSLANIDWCVDFSDPVQAVGTPDILLVNDFVAQAYACRSDAVADARVILPGETDPEGAVAVVGAGTGLGKCALIPDGRGHYTALPSEGGHSDMPFLTEDEFAYYRYLQKETGFRQITSDIVVAGPGLTHLHRFLTGHELKPAEVAATFDGEGARTLRWAARFYGRTCRNYAIEVLATGGVYVTGGVAAKSPEIIEHPAFAEEFRLCEAPAGLMDPIPLLLNHNEDSGLWGAALVGVQHLGIKPLCT